MKRDYFTEEQIISWKYGRDDYLIRINVCKENKNKDPKIRKNNKYSRNDRFLGMENTVSLEVIL